MKLVESFRSAAHARRLAATLSTSFVMTSSRPEVQSTAHLRLRHGDVNGVQGTSRELRSEHAANEFTDFLLIFLKRSKSKIRSASMLRRRLSKYKVSSSELL